MITQTALAIPGLREGAVLGIDGEMAAALSSAVVGVVVGALLSLLLGGIAGSRASRRRESSALRFLVSSFAQRRAFRPRVDSGADASKDRSRLIASILAARDLANETRRELRPKSYAWDHIIRIVAECNGFLEKVEERPLEYRALARELSDELRAPFLSIIQKEDFAASPESYLPGSLAYPVGMAVSDAEG